MNAHRDLDEQLTVFLREGPDELPWESFDAVRDRTDQTEQRTFIGPWRAPAMNKITFGLGAAAVVLIGAVIGAQLLGSPGNTGSGGPSATPQATATPEPTASPSPSARYPTWYPPAAVADANGAGILSAGSHATRVFSPAFTFSAPDGWVNAYDEPGYFTLFPDTPANQTEYARSDELAHHVFMGLQNRPWYTCEALEDNQGATAAEIVAAMEGNEVLAMSDLTEVVIGGLSGVRFDVRRNPDWTGTCPGDSGLPEGIDPDDERMRSVLLDVPGRGVLLIMVYSASSAGHEAFFSEAMTIVESFQFTQ